MMLLLWLRLLSCLQMQSKARAWLLLAGWPLLLPFSFCGVADDDDDPPQAKPSALIK
jgi:hypothetical protein